MVTLLFQQISAHGRSSSNVNGGPELDRCMSPEGSAQSEVYFVKEVTPVHVMATADPLVLNCLPEQGCGHAAS